MKRQTGSGRVGYLDGGRPWDLCEIVGPGRGVDGESGALAETLDQIEKKRAKLVFECRRHGISPLEGGDGRADDELAGGVAGEHAEIDQLGGKPARRGSGKTGPASELTDTNRGLGGGNVLEHPEGPLDRAGGC